MIHIVADSSCDLPQDIIKKYDIKIVPLVVNIDGELYRERVDITPKEFYHKMAGSKALPKTSQPSPAIFMEVFNQLSKTGQVLCLTISSGLSGTYQSAGLGKDLSDGDIVVFDSLAGSLGHGLQIIRAAEMVEAGSSMEEIITELSEYRSRMSTLVLLHTLDNIVKGGRLSKFEGSLGKLLDFRILLHNDEKGNVVLQQKVRGKKTFMKKVVGEIIERASDLSDTPVGITHFNNPEDTEYIINQLKEKCQAQHFIVNDMGSTMATYAGEGGMIIAF